MAKPTNNSFKKINIGEEHPTLANYFFSKLLAILNISVSLKCLPITCKPKGIPLLCLNKGTQIAGMPTRLEKTVYKSAKYIATESLFLAPILNAVEGTVGDRIAS